MAQEDGENGNLLGAGEQVPAACGVSWWVHADVVVRVAGLPMRSLEGLRAERTWQQIGRLREGQAYWRGESRRLADMLEAHIGTVEPGRRRGLLVALRRAVFGGRALRGRIDPAQLGAVLPAGLDMELAAWQDGQARLAREAERLSAVPAAEIGGCGQAVPGWMAEAGVRHGLWHASPVLAGELDKWLAAAPGTMAERKVVSRLARYLSRVVVKTSPFTTFTAWGLGRLTAAPPSAHSPASAGIVQVDAWFTQRCAWAMAARDDLGPRLPLRLNSSATDGPDAVVFLGAAAGEPVHEIRLTPMLRACLRAVRTRPSRHCPDGAGAGRRSGGVAAGLRRVERAAAVGGPHRGAPAAAAGHLRLGGTGAGVRRQPALPAVLSPAE
ncbi:hypothetical protein Misp01_77940 [Microtetraspora sp. NBRC 13810]|uniref:lantibiotic dehydratase n=1 Tax=Microtetraspora sp. NBRC 13810 TaxID=3030990 RepID=UPI0024A37F69|nr:lantibiotic dehydratase [Microtetraspora sp. NBRC 13810]GLW12666.1 hypothetical protein Misp01_77940 [Microtetraspora sp. NBRC 13810]